MLKLLRSRKPSLSQTAALVLSNCTGEDHRVALALIALEKENSPETTEHDGLAPLIEHLTDSDSIVALHVAKTLAHCTAACNDQAATLKLSGLLRQLGGTRLLIGCLSPHSKDEKVTAAVLLSLGNMCCDDAILCNEMREMGAFESLLLLLRPGRPLILRDRATSTLLNCVEGTEISSRTAMEKELASIGAVSALSRAIETLIDGRQVATGSATSAANVRQDGMSRVTEPMTCGLLDLLLRCCSVVDKVGASGCDELQDCGGVQLMMILLDDSRQSVQEKACRLLACACGSAGRNARDIKRSVWSLGGGALEQLVSLVKHRKKGIAKSARRCLDALRNRSTLLTGGIRSVSSSKSLATKLENGNVASAKKSNNTMISDDEVLLPLIEQGIVPIFHKMATEDDMDVGEATPHDDVAPNVRRKSSTAAKATTKQSTKTAKKAVIASTKRKNLSKRFAADYLAWLQMAVCGGKQGGSSTFRVLLRTLCMNGNEELRGHVAIALVILCFNTPTLRTSFVQEGALDATLSMLRYTEGRTHALEFLYTMEPIVRKCAESKSFAKDAAGGALTNPYAAAAAGTCVFYKSSKLFVSLYFNQLFHLPLVVSTSLFLLSWLRPTATRIIVRAAY